MKSFCENCVFFVPSKRLLIVDRSNPPCYQKPPKELRAEKKQPKRKTTQENTKIHTPDLNTANKKCLKTTSDCVDHIHKRNTSNPLFNQQAVYRYCPFPPLLICLHPRLRYFNQDRMDKWLTQVLLTKIVGRCVGVLIRVVDRPR